MAQSMAPSIRQTPALEAVDRLLVAQTNGQADRAMIFVAPQEGKSQRVSCWYVLWRLTLDPSLRIAIVSYQSGKAERWGRWVRRMIEAHPDLGVNLMRDSRAVDRFETTAGGMVVSVGIDGGITGEHVDLMVIDDPVRGRAEAESPTYRGRAWDWWESNAATRFGDRGGQVVLMMTRWHADDLAGRLLKNEPGEWRVLRIPAIREPGIDVRGNDGASAYHPNGELISVRNRPLGYFRELRAKRSAYVWRSVYDQNPVQAEGNLFPRADYRYWRFAPRNVDATGPLRGTRVHLRELDTIVALDDCWRFLTVDLAASTKTSADWTVAAVWAITRDGVLILLDRARGRVEETGHWDLVRPLCRRWAAPDVYVERGFIGTTLVVDATRSGVRVLPMDVEKDKLTRALPATHRVKAHLVWFPAEADWLDEWCDELAAFPAGRNDDQVDTLSGAARITSAHWVAEPSAKVDQARRAAAAQRSAADLAFESATGVTGTIDWSSAEF